MTKRKTYIFQHTATETTCISPELTITTITSKDALKDFYYLPWQIYQNDPNWVPPFWREYKEFFMTKNPFWTHAEAQLYIATVNQKPVGRIAAIIDHLLNKREKKNIGYFGFFECINDPMVAKVLFNAAQDWLAEKNMTLMRGPINGRIDVGCGFLLKGFDSPPSLLGAYSPQYYITFAEHYGMKKCRDLYSYYMDLRKPIPKSLYKAAEDCTAQGITIRGFNRLQANRELSWWIPLMMKQFAFHWGYVPVSEEEVRTRFGVKQARWFIDSGLFLIAEINGKPICFKWSTPDYNQVFKTMDGKIGFLGLLKFFLGKRRITRGNLNFVGIEKEYRGRGIGTCMNYHTMVEMKRRGYTGAECGWIDEQNIASQRAIEKTGATQYKIFRVYEKTIVKKNNR